MFLTGYFVGIYVYTVFSVAAYKDSFEDLRMIHDRSICLTKLFFLAREDLITGRIANMTEYNSA